MRKTKKQIQTDKIDVKELNNRIDSFDKKMHEVRRDFIQKSTNSKKSASELVLTS